MFSMRNFETHRSHAAVLSYSKVDAESESTTGSIGKDTVTGTSRRIIAIVCSKFISRVKAGTARQVHTKALKVITKFGTLVFNTSGTRLSTVLGWCGALARG